MWKEIFVWYNAVKLSKTDLHHLEGAPVGVAGHVCQVGVAGEEAAAEAGQDAGEEDGGEGLRPEGQHHPGEETGHGGDYQQPARSNKLLKDASENSHDDGWDI